MSVHEQILGYCTCAKEATVEDVTELINMVSMATGWMRKPCETFLKDDRREVIDLPDCLDCPLVFDPYYHPFDVDSFTFTLVTIKGTEETLTPITDFAYHESDEKFHVNVGLPKCGCVSCSCGCPPSYKMIVEYSAGYEVIPECLLDVFCNVLEVIHSKNDCCCEKDCGCSDGEQDIKYATGDVVTVQLDTDIGKMLVSLYMTQLAMLSLSRPEPFWGVIV